MKKLFFVSLTANLDVTVGNVVADNPTEAIELLHDKSGKNIVVEKINGTIVSVEEVADIFGTCGISCEPEMVFKKSQVLNYYYNEE